MNLAVCNVNTSHHMTHMTTCVIDNQIRRSLAIWKKNKTKQNKTKTKQMTFL